MLLLACLHRQRVKILATFGSRSANVLAVDYLLVFGQLQDQRQLGTQQLARNASRVR